MTRVNFERLTTTLARLAAATDGGEQRLAGIRSELEAAFADGLPPWSDERDALFQRLYAATAEGLFAGWRGAFELAVLGHGAMAFVMLHGLAEQLALESLASQLTRREPDRSVQLRLLRSKQLPQLCTALRELGVLTAGDAKATVRWTDLRNSIAHGNVVRLAEQATLRKPRVAVDPSPIREFEAAGQLANLFELAVRLWVECVRQRARQSVGDGASA